MGEAIEGTTLGTNKRYWGGEEGDTIFRWILVGYLRIDESWERMR
jgi:hypothetical protein